ncbi:SDR family oxidoreductase [Haloechinothrix salitolerans]|uniref:SDR family oxidoreductase n=1 Tax=Haloechinothrix salitolerans TaxID=926830 RepID=A0ABW2C3D9_9PSEU
MALRWPRRRGRHPVPLKRLGAAQDVGSAAAFLLVEDSGWVTGPTLVIDGGLAFMGGVE